MTSMIHTVLCGTSLTEGSEAVVGNALKIARAAGARLHLVHAFDLIPLYYDLRFSGGAYVPSMIEDLRASCLQSMQAQVSRLGIRAEELAGVTPLEGAPHGVLIETAESVGADLIVVGAADSQGRVEQLLGSTADRVIRAASCPVVATRGRLAVPPRRVMFAVDLSAASVDALAGGLDVVAAMGAGPGAASGRAAVEVLFVAEDRPPSDARPSAAAVQKLQQFLASRGLDPAWQLRARVRRGMLAAYEILQHCQDAAPDLIVVGTHGHGGFVRLLLGSVAESVLRGAQQSVLLVPPKTFTAVRRAGVRAQTAVGA